MTVTTGPGEPAFLMTAEELGRRRAAFERADHSLRLEGLTATPAAEAIARTWVRGEISDEDRAERTRALHIPGGR